MIRGKQNDDSSADTGFSRPLGAAPSASSTASAPAAADSSKPAAVIGPKIRFKGELVGEEDLLVQGQIDGTIDLKGNNLTIGEQGVVKANVLAQTITIEGTVEGDVFGQERISIRSTSHVKGNLVAERVTLEDGAKFKGSIDMEVDSRKDDFQKFNSGSSMSSSASSKSPAAPSGAAGSKTPS
jgi:cytoskeletal protein CcmA (bactofilin family)